MKIVMIKPNMGLLSVSNGKVVPYDDRGRMEPLQLGVLAGLTPDDIEVKLYDDRLEEIDFDEPADLVAITVEVYTAKRAYEISDKYRERKIPVVLGGIHVSAVPDEAQAHADAIIIGDAEGSWHELLSDFESGNLKARYEGIIGPGHEKKFPRRTIYEDKYYVPVTLLQYARGCPFVCTFCAIGKYFKGSIHHRSIEEVIAEVKSQKRRFLFFVDDNINGDKERAKELYRALIPLNVLWIGQSSIDMTDDLELMELMSKSGCIGLVIGFESITDEGLRAYNKTPNVDPRYKEQIRILRKHNIHIWASFILGHDEETIQSMQATLDFAIKNKFSFAAFNILMPYPGTAIYKKLEKQNRLKFGGKWWLSDEYRFNHATFEPNRLSADELTEFTFYMRRKFNSWPMLLRRFFAIHNLLNLRSLGIFLQFLWTFRKETLKKQSMSLGYKKRQPANKYNYETHANTSVSR